MNNVFKKSFWIQIWLLPVVIIHLALFIYGDIYSNGYTIFSFILCVIWTLAAGTISSFFYESICDDVTSPIPTVERLITTGTRAHIFLFAWLAITVLISMLQTQLSY